MLREQCQRKRARRRKEEGDKITHPELGHFFHSFVRQKLEHRSQGDEALDDPHVFFC